MTKTFSNYEEAWAYYVANEGVMTTVIPGQLWKVTVF